MAINSLKNYNSFGLEVSSKEIIILNSLNQLYDIDELESHLILGGGSNVLFTRDLEQKVIVNQTKGITEHHLSEDEVILELCSGEVWHDVVLYAVERNYGGIENLSLIPGSVGAAPMQNIGAYGVEVKDVIQRVEAFNLKTKEIEAFSNSDCCFGYRESVFKRDLKGKYFITKVFIKLSKINHKLNTDYGAIFEVLQSKNIETPTIKEISEAVIEIRRSKLPDPNVLGNAGSFFKNPVISATHYKMLKEKFPDIRSYIVDEEHVKVPAGWLIDSLGWKGKRHGNAGVHVKQALVLVNHGNATGEEILELSRSIQKSVLDTYMIELETEVNIL